MIGGNGNPARVGSTHQAKKTRFASTSVTSGFGALGLRRRHGRVAARVASTATALETEGCHCRWAYLPIKGFQFVN